MPALPTFSAHDCRFLRRYEHSRTPFERIPSADQTYLRDIRSRLQSLAQVAVHEYHGHLEMTDFVSALSPHGRATGKYVAGIYPRSVGDERVHKSSHLQLAVCIMPEGFEISFGRGGGKSFNTAVEKVAATHRQLAAVKSALAHLSVPLIAHVERKDGC